MVIKSNDKNDDEYDSKKGREKAARLGGGAAGAKGFAGLSRRGSAALKPALPYLGLFVKALADQYDAETNPEGYIALCVAENKLTHEDMSREVQRIARECDISGEFLQYNDMRGTPTFKTAAAQLMSAVLTDGRETISSDTIVGASGCGAILETLMFLLTDAGDCVICPAPYYPAFDNDLTVRGRLRIVPAQMQKPPGAGRIRITQRSLEDALAQCKGRGKVLLLTNPHNPLGCCLSREEIITTMRFCKRNQLHLVSDEIYAGSVYMDGVEFTSVLALRGEDHEVGEALQEGIVHVVYGLSKDFCVSGFRVGFFAHKQCGRPCCSGQH